MYIYIILYFVVNKNPGPGSYQIAKAYNFLDTTGKYPK